MTEELHEKTEETISSNVQKTYVDCTYRIVLDKDIATADEYREAFSILNEANQNSNIIIEINTDGGDLDTALTFITKIRQCPALITADVYKAYSAGAMIMLACDAIQTYDHTTMMLHAPHFGFFGTQHENKSYNEFINKRLEAIYSDICKGFLTDKEMTKLYDGEWYWFNNQEIQKRLINFVKSKERT